jgi:alpha-beta hydrolase superfamily lysophospholipase
MRPLKFPLPKVFKRTRRRKTLLFSTLSTILFAVLLLNLIAFMQARAMTHFVDAGNRTRSPEALGLLKKIEVLFTGVRVPRPADTATPSAIDLPFQTIRFGGQSHDNCEAWLIPAQNPAQKHKALCIAFHGYASSKSSLLQPAKAFHDLGYDVMLVDFRGSGASLGNDTTIGYREAEDTAAAENYATDKWPDESIILYGQSMGGAAILRAIAQLHVHPSAVIIESTYDRLLSTVECRFSAMGLPSFPLARLLVFWGGEQLGYGGFALNPADYATHLNCPVLMMQGGLDPRVTNAQALNLFNHLAGPKRFELFETAGHCDFLNQSPYRWKKSTADFLQISLHQHPQLLDAQP